jgi:hypothetical protein
MGNLTDRMNGYDIKEWFIKDNGSVPYDFREIEAKIQNGEITSETLLCKPPDPSSYGNPKKEFKEAGKYHELKSVFNRLPPA